MPLFLGCTFCATCSTAALIRSSISARSWLRTFATRFAFQRTMPAVSAEMATMTPTSRDRSPMSKPLSEGSRIAARMCMGLLVLKEEPRGERRGLRWCCLGQLR
jgi:hypothetical protein